jgi:hypothetical protein
VKPGFATRLRAGLLVGLFVAFGIIAMDIMLGKWEGLRPERLLTLVIAVMVTAMLWAFLTGLQRKDDDA